MEEETARADQIRNYTYDELLDRVAKSSKKKIPSSAKKGATR